MYTKKMTDSVGILKKNMCIQKLLISEEGSGASVKHIPDDS